MSKSQRLKNAFDQAKGKEEKYDWLEASELYGQTLGIVRKEDFWKRGEIQELIGQCLYRAAFQAEAREEFKKHMRLSVGAYERAAGHFERLTDPKKQARANFCKGMASYRDSWLANNSSDRKRLLNECWKFEKLALKIYEKASDRLGYGKSCNELLTCLFDRLMLTWDWQERKPILEEAIEHGERAIEALSEVGDKYELAKTYHLLSWFYCYMIWGICESIEEQKEITQKSLTCAQKAMDISEEVGDSYLIGMSSFAIWWLLFVFKNDLESSLGYAKKQLELGERTKDRLMIARACEGLALVNWVKTKTEEDPDKRREGFEKVIRYAGDAMIHHQRFCYLFTYVYGTHTDCYSELAFGETSLEAKRTLLEKAVEVGRKSLEPTKHLGSYTIPLQVFRSLTKALYFLSIVETRISEKRRLLEEASKYGEETINLWKQILPFDYWVLGVGYNYSALIKAELAEIETDNQKKKDFVKNAVVDMEECLKLCKKAVAAWPDARYFRFIGQYQNWFGGILRQLYLLTSEKKHLERAIRIYKDAVQAWDKAGLHSRVAEVHWQAARFHDLLGEHLKAAQAFELASERYTLAAEKLPQLKAFYTDHAVYMKAWNEIEHARFQHVRGQYGKAKEYYQKAATLHESTARWSYLSPNYSAWAQLEEAEDLSRSEQTEGARDLFQQAAKQFAEAGRSISAKLEEMEDVSEKTMATSLAKALDIKHDFCLGRIAIEEARTLDRQGDHAASSRKYGAAAEIFRKAADSTESESDRQELRPIICLSQAWQIMTRAEAEASPDLYLEASRLFEDVKAHSVDEKAKVLALGHSRFCKALEAGARFEDTIDASVYSEAKKHLEAAANHYVRAEFRNASEYAKATGLLFDAYMYTYKAETDLDATKKSQYYQMVEKLLLSSAGSYTKAKHPEKSKQVKRLLESIKEKRQIAMSLSEVLHAPTITSTTTSFSTPTPTHERAVGLERFEQADVQANLILRAKDVKVGDDVSLAIELVNAGKAPALLIKVDEIVPEGFEIKDVPEIYTVEDSFLNLKGRRLNPLKTEDVKMVVNPRSKGMFIVKPRVLYIDEAGKYRSHEPEPVTITVKELGIKGWIKGKG